VIQDTARWAFDGLEHGLARWAARQPRSALAGAAALGRTRNRLSRRWPAPEEVRALFPHLDPRAAARVAWSIGGLEARNRVLAASLRRAGLDPVRPLVRVSFPPLRPPLLLGTFHVGAMHALGPALERLPGPVLALRHGPLYRPRPPVEMLSTAGDEQSRATVFQRALSHLTGGGFVAMALDVAPGPGLRVPCLGRTLELARGPFALARLTGAPIRPLVARWQAGGVEVEVGEPLAAGGQAVESALATAAGRWLADYLLASPTETGLGLLRSLLAGGLNQPR
jgi:hypothetical protein